MLLARRALAALALLVLAAGLTACSSGKPATTKDAPLKVGLNVIPMPDDRSATVHVPKGLDGPAPLVLVLHHYTGTSGSAMQYGFEKLAETNRFVAVYPDAVNGAWNAGGCCGDAPGRGTDDVAFITAVVERVEKDVDVDPDRVFVAGFSNGGMLAYRLGCETKLFAALAPIAADLEADCPDPAPASVMHVHGLADPMVDFDAASDDPWRKADQCGAPQTSDAPPVHRSAAECADGRAVEVVTLDKVGHEVPTDFQGLATAQEVWAFFQAHPRS